MRKERASFTLDKRTIVMLKKLVSSGKFRNNSHAVENAILVLNEQAPKETNLLYDPGRGLGWVDPKHKWQVYFGLNPAGMDERLIMYNTIVKELNRRKIKATLISVEYLHAPYYRMD